MKKLKFLVTGGAGFIGSNIVEFLLENNHEVRVLDNLSTGYLKNISEYLSNPNFEFIEGDITNLDICQLSCKGIDYVLHQAELGSVPRSIDNPILTHTNNVNGTLNMLVAAKDNNVKRFIYASSSSVYGDSLSSPKKIGDEGNLLSPYAVSKKTCEEYAKVFQKVYGLETIGMRYFNVFGKRQDPTSTYSALIPKFIKQIMNNEIPVIYGDGKNSRDFTYIKNIIDFNYKACFSGKESTNKVYNVGAGGCVTVLEVFEEIKRLLNKDIEIEYTENRKGDINHSLAEISESINEIGYEAKFDFYSGMVETLEWYEKNRV